MSSTLPKAIFSNSHSSFALIDPATNIFHRRLGTQDPLTLGLRRHVAISYVWSDWKDDVSQRLPNWTAVRERLLSVVGPAAPDGLKKETHNATACWIDCKCIDQDSDTDKAYWIPRMDEVYTRAQCTILLLRNVDLTALQELVQDMSCPYKGKLNSIDELLAGPHNCLLSQYCTVLPDLDPDRELRCLDALRTLARGVWRRRAWIHQEILLSQNYLLSWSQGGWMSLADAGVIAGLLARQHPEDVLLADFATWCRRLWFLRHNYETDVYELSDANVLQLSQDLEATMPADKFYALCGILRLKTVQYNAKHTIDEALQNVISELVRNGRLSWLYAVRPPLSGPEINVEPDDLAPFLLTRLEGRLLQNRHSMRLEEGILGLTAYRVGTVMSTWSLTEFLDLAVEQLKRPNRDADIHPEQTHLFYAPNLIRRLGLDILDPLTTRAVRDQVCQSLGIPLGQVAESVRSAHMILCLYTLDTDQILDKGLGNYDPFCQMAIGAALSIQRRVSEAAENFTVVRVITSTPDDHAQATPEKQPGEDILLGFPTAVVGSSVYSVAGDKHLLLATSESSTSNDARRNVENLVFRGMLFQLKVTAAIGHPPSRLYSATFWKSLGKGLGDKPHYVTFPYSHAT